MLKDNFTFAEVVFKYILPTPLSITHPVAYLPSALIQVLPWLVQHSLLKEKFEFVFYVEGFW